MGVGCYKRGNSSGMGMYLSRKISCLCLYFDFGDLIYVGLNMKFHCYDVLSECGVSMSVYAQEQVVDKCVGVYHSLLLYGVQKY